MLKTVKNKNNFEDIEDSLLLLSKDITDSEALKKLELGLKGTLPEMSFKVNISIPKNDSTLFIMSVYPEGQATLNKCIDAIVTGKDEKIISELWKKNSKWTIEIDSRIFDLELTKQELTAIILHELGHVVYSNYIPHVMGTIVRYELLSKPLTSKIMMKGNDIARKIMSLPIINACFGYSRKDSSIKEEISADKFVVKMGYKNELKSALDKITKSTKYKKLNKDNKAVLKTAKLSDEAFDELKARHGKLSKSISLLKKESYDSEFIDRYLESMDYSGIEDYIIESVECDTSSFDSLFDPDNVFLEFFGMKKDLDKVESMIIDYILVKINDMKTENDRMMVLSYIHSKLDIIGYYMDILKDPKLKKKYKVPNSEAELKIYQQQLFDLRKAAIQKKLPEKNKGLLVQWPEEYGG